MCKKCSCGKRQLEATPELITLLKVRDALSILVNINYELKVTDGKRGCFMNDELDYVNNKIEILANGLVSR